MTTTTTTPARDIVRHHVGRRTRITSGEMRAILLALPLDLAAVSTIAARDDEGRLHLPTGWVEPTRATPTCAPGECVGHDEIYCGILHRRTDGRCDCLCHVPPSMRPLAETPEQLASREREAVADAWSRACTGITVISVWGPRGDEYPGGIRFDMPGSMHPLQHADLMFVAARLGDYDHDQIGLMRRKAHRVLIISDAHGEEA